MGQTWICFAIAVTLGAATAIAWSNTVEYDSIAQWKDNGVRHEMLRHRKTGELIEHQCPWTGRLESCPRK